MKKIVIIGGGVAGLSAGIRLQEMGFDCTILEKNATPGGNLTGWDREGYHIDNCMHWLTGTAPGGLFEMWREVGMLGEDIPLYRAPYFYRSELGGKSAALYPSLEQTRRSLLAVSPEDGKEIDGFLSAVARTAELQMAQNNMQAVLCGLRMAGGLWHYGRLSLSELAARFRSPLLRCLLTDYIGGEFNAMGLIFAYAAYAFGNGSLPAGGSRAAALRMADRFATLGGRLLTSCEVRRVACTGRRVRGVFTAKGEYHPADAVIAACDPTVTFGKLFPRAAMPRRLAAMYLRHGDRRFSAFHAAFGCDASAVPAFGTLCFSAPELPERGGRMVLREYGYEPSFAPRGKRLLQVMQLLDEQESRAFLDLSSGREEDRAAYRERCAARAGACAAAILRRFPAAKKSLTLLDTWSPVTYRRYLGSESGSFMSFYVPGGVIPRTLPASVAGYENLFLATQWQTAPGGLPLAAQMGFRAAEAVEKAAVREERRARVGVSALPKKPAVS